MDKKEMIEMINANGRKANLLIECRNLPVIGLTHIGRSGQVEIHTTIDLKEFASEIVALKDDEVFAIGRDINCDFCPRLKEFISNMYGVAPSRTQLTEGEELYLRVYRTISRVHAYVEKTATGFKIYDCSKAGTVIIPASNPKLQQTPVEEPKKKENLWNKIRKIF